MRRAQTKSHREKAKRTSNQSKVQIRDTEPGIWVSLFVLGLRLGSWVHRSSAGWKWKNEYEYEIRIQDQKRTSPHCGTLDPKFTVREKLSHFQNPRSQAPARCLESSCAGKCSIGQSTITCCILRITSCILQSGTQRPSRK